MSIRQASVAGLFYPDDKNQLQQTVEQLLQDNHQRSSTKPAVQPRALVVPHAGLQYSGAIAAQNYNLLTPWADHIKRVVLLGPCHRVAVDGMALSTANEFATPLGNIAVDIVAEQRLIDLPHIHGLHFADQAHAREHSLEVQLPFLQAVLKDFSIIPIVVGECEATDVEAVIQALWDEQTLVVISTDLSHFLPYEIANDLDHHTINHILDYDHQLHGQQACGCKPLNGLLLAAEEQHMAIDLIAYANSGDTANFRLSDKNRVVGYGAFSVH